MTDDSVAQFEEDVWGAVTDGEQGFLTFGEMAEILRDAADTIDSKHE